MLCSLLWGSRKTRIEELDPRKAKEQKTQLQLTSSLTVQETHDYFKVLWGDLQSQEVFTDALLFITKWNISGMYCRSMVFLFSAFTGAVLFNTPELPQVLANCGFHNHAAALMVAEKDEARINAEKEQARINAEKEEEESILQIVQMLSVTLGDKRDALHSRFMVAINQARERRQLTKVVDCNSLLHLAAKMKVAPSQVAPNQDQNWKGIECFKPNEQKALCIQFIAPGVISTSTFAMNPPLHFDEPTIDRTLAEATSPNQIVNLLAPSSNGKSSAVFRFLSLNHGLYMDGWAPGDGFLGPYQDTLSKELVTYLNLMRPFEVHLWAEPVVHIAVIAKLAHLLYRTNLFDGVPSASIFLTWQVNGQTVLPKSLFKEMIKLNFHQLPMTNLAELITELGSQLNTALKTDLIPFFVDEA